MREKNVYKGYSTKRRQPIRGRGKQTSKNNLFMLQVIASVLILVVSVAIKNIESDITNNMQDMIARSLNVSTDFSKVQVLLDELKEAKDKAVNVFAPKEDVEVEDEGTEATQSSSDNFLKGDARVITTVYEVPMSFDEITFYEDFDSGEMREEKPMEKVTDNDILLGLTAPIKGVLTSNYGVRINPITKKESFHYGVDIDPMKNSYEIKAAYGGVVKEVGKSNAFGNYIVIKHSDELETFYAHCEKIYKTQGEEVENGENIAYVGSTGWSTGNHLHFEIRGEQKVYNPLDYIGVG